MTQGIESDPQRPGTEEGSVTPASTSVEKRGAIPASDGVQVLLDTSAMLLSSLSVEAVLTRIVDLAQQIIKADAYAVWRTYDARRWRVLAASGLSQEYRRELVSEQVVAPRFQAIADVSQDDSLGRYQEVYRREGIRSMLVVPLQLADPLPEGPNGGTITFYWRELHEASHLDIFYASALANLSSAALRISELHEQNQREKTRLAFLAEASETLASSLEYEDTLQRVARLAVPRIADWCAVHVVEEGAPVRLAMAHADPEMLEAFQRGGEFVAVEHRAVRSDCSIFWSHSRGRIERNAGGEAIGVVGIAMDITERRQSEEALRKTEKLAAAGRLAATVAHEINNPLESIVNLIYLCRNTPGLPQDAAKFLGMADEELARIAQIVRQTLGFYRESVDPRRSDICKIVSEIVDVYRPRILARSLAYSMDLEP